MARIKEFWTFGNLVINSTGGLNFNVLDKLKSWEIKGKHLILHQHTRGVDGINYYPLLSLSISREDKIQELTEFFNEYNIPYRITE